MHYFQFVPHYYQNNVSILKDLVIPIFSLIATFAAAVSAYFSYKVMHDTFKDNINKLFFEISSNVSTPPSINDKAKICNYFEYICRLKRTKKLDAGDLELQSEVMKTPNLIDFIKSERTRNKNNVIYGEYWSWLKEKRLV